jgi:peroxiredoxin
LFGLSSQDTDFQKELVANAHLNFPILSDQKLELTKALNFPLMEVKGEPMIKRMAMIIDEGGQIKKVFYPVFPPDRNAKDVLEWMQNEQKGNK